MDPFGCGPPVPAAACSERRLEPRVPPPSVHPRWRRARPIDERTNVAEASTMVHAERVPGKETLPGSRQSHARTHTRHSPYTSGHTWSGVVAVSDRLSCAWRHRTRARRERETSRPRSTRLGRVLSGRAQQRITDPPHATDSEKMRFNRYLSTYMVAHVQERAVAPCQWQALQWCAGVEVREHSLLLLRAHQGIPRVDLRLWIDTLRIFTGA